MDPEVQNHWLSRGMQSSRHPGRQSVGPNDTQSTCKRDAGGWVPGFAEKPHGCLLRVLDIHQKTPRSRRGTERLEPKEF